MKLLYQTHSPYARKVLVFAHEAGIAKDIDVVHCETSPTNRNEEIYQLNPLGKVPVLLLEDQTTIFESGLICEYLNSIALTGLIPTGIGKKVEALKTHALSDGLSEAGILVRWETTRRPEEYRYKEFEIAQTNKIDSTLTYLNSTLNFQELHIGHIGLASALSWLEFRGVVKDYRKWPSLQSWYNEFSSRESMKATQLAGETFD